MALRTTRRARIPRRWENAVYLRMREGVGRMKVGRSRLEIIVELLDRLAQIKPKSLALSQLSAKIGLNYTTLGKPLITLLHEKYLVKFEEKNGITRVSITQSGLEKLRSIKQLLNDLGLADFEEWEKYGKP